MKDPDSPTMGLHVHSDRYYISPELLKMKSFLTDTVMVKRCEIPLNLKNEVKKIQNDDVFSQRKDNTGSVLKG